ncbi:hypothetical protein CKO43_21755 [Rubrivivax gelatinosus]|uniref:Thermostable hemolysin n=2 Tax=Rubrivivax gelatinosus TaxID=28068 RepID=A0ABS1E1C9_RUBGE|nr:hypothetical protein [Rubrivivax gelatinosus]
MPSMLREPSMSSVQRPGAQARLRVYPGEAGGRHQVEALVRRVYRERYRAEVREFAPAMVGLHDSAGALVAAAGYRPARDGALFLERYLDAPVEALLGEPVERARIVEVGHLAAARAGEGRRLITRIGPHLAEQGYDWVVCTLTVELRHLFVRLGIAPVTLGVADPDLLGADAARWGSYYDHRPLVLAGRLDTAIARFKRRGGQL